MMYRFCVVVLSLGLVLVFVMRTSFEAAPTGATAPGTPAAGTPEAGIPGVEMFKVDSAAHVEGPVTYPQTPPVGGPHNPVWQNCGFYNRVVASERVVHSMEHGAVWITFQPDLPKAQIAVLKRLAGRNDHVLISPFPGLSDPVVASAWGEQLRLKSVSDPRLKEFVRAFAGHGPERNAPCDGSTTETGPLQLGTPVATVGSSASIAGTPVGANSP